MILKRLSIINYKNITSATLDFSPKLNAFIGPNGVGKTNLLDAVYYLSFCRSAFNPVDSQVITHDAPVFVLEGNYETESGDEEHIYCGMKRGQRKHFKRNQKEYKRLSQHIGLIPLIFVSPADSNLIEGGSEERRRLMDVVISQYDSAYLEALTRYGKALQQRNTLLKQEEMPDGSLLDIWEEEMAGSGELIYAARKAFIADFIPVFQDIYSRIAQGSEQVSLSYRSHCQRGPLLDVIRAGRDKDRIMGFSLHGVHRDDLDMLIGDYPLKKEGSQGQHKTFALALKLAQFDFLRKTASATTPLLLLDDIFDKLDAARVEAIIKLVSGSNFGQIFVTDTNRDHLDRILSAGFTDYRLFAVSGGEVTLKKEGSHV